MQQGGAQRPSLCAERLPRKANHEGIRKSFTVGSAAAAAARFTMGRRMVEEVVVYVNGLLVLCMKDIAWKRRWKRAKRAQKTQIDTHIVSEICRYLRPVPRGTADGDAK